MPWCPQCGAEYRAGVERCYDCDVPLQAGRPASAEPSSEAPWVRLTVVQGGVTRAHVIRGLLESAGIPVQLRYEAAGRVYGAAFGPLGEVEIWVPREALGRARELLEAPPDLPQG